MLTRGYRSGRVGVLATLVLLFSIVLFVGCLFWLTVEGPWGGGSIFGDDLFKPASFKTEQETMLNDTKVETLNISSAKDDLQASGCIFTEYSDTYSEEQTISLSFTEFKEKAVNRKIVFTAETPETAILLVIKDGKLYEWRP
jgi:hypothetical protein